MVIIRLFDASRARQNTLSTSVSFISFWFYIPATLPDDTSPPFQLAFRLNRFHRQTLGPSRDPVQQDLLSSVFGSVGYRWRRILSESASVAPACYRRLCYPNQRSHADFSPCATSSALYFTLYWFAEISFHQTYTFLHFANIYTWIHIYKICRPFAQTCP